MESVDCPHNVHVLLLMIVYSPLSPALLLTAVMEDAPKMPVIVILTFQTVVIVLLDHKFAALSIINVQQGKIVYVKQILIASLVSVVPKIEIHQ